MQKTTLRQTLRQQRSRLTPAVVTSGSQQIRQHLAQLPIVNQATRIFTYLSFNNEVDTFPFIQEHFRSKTFYAPYIVDEDRQLMQPALITSLDDLAKKSFGILTPASKTFIDIQQIELTLVPGVAFDRQGGRLGMGKGYYDRLLAGYRGTLIGLAYDFQLIDEVPVNEHDIRMDYIITEKTLIHCPRRK